MTEILIMKVNSKQTIIILYSRLDIAILSFFGILIAISVAVSVRG